MTDHTTLADPDTEVDESLDLFDEDFVTDEEAEAAERKRDERAEAAPGPQASAGPSAEPKTERAPDPAGASSAPSPAPKRARAPSAVTDTKQEKARRERERRAGIRRLSLPLGPDQYRDLALYAEMKGVTIEGALELLRDRFAASVAEEVAGYRTERELRQLEEQLLELERKREALTRAMAARRS